MKVVKRVPIKKKSKDHSHKTIKAKPKRVKKSSVVTVIALIVIAALLYVALNTEQLGSLFSGGDVVARVNGRPIYESELEIQYSQVPQLYREQFTRKIILDQMVTQEVLLQEAQNMGLEITEEEMDERMDEAIVNSGMSREQFMQMLEAQNTTFEEIRDFYEVSLLIDKLITQEVISGINITEEEKRDYYEENKEEFYQNETQVRASHILISTEMRSNESAYNLSLEILESAQGGENFTELAREYSDDPSVANNGGDLGYFTRGMMVKPFEEAVFEMDVGEISGPVRTSFGYHIVYKVDEREPGYLEYEDVKDSIENFLIQQKQQDVVQVYIQALRDEAQVEYFGPYKNESFQEGEMSGDAVADVEQGSAEGDLNPSEEAAEEDSPEEDNTVESDVDEMEQDIQDMEEESEDSEQMNEELEEMLNETS